MRKLMACLAALITIGVSQSSAAVIFSNLGPGDSFNTGNGWLTATSQYIAMPFTVGGGDHFFTSAEVGLVNFTGATQGFTVRLRADNAGLPGTILDSDPVSVPAGSGLYSLTSNTTTLLQNGSTYWIEVLSTSTSSSTGWGWVSSGATGPFAFSVNGGATYFSTGGTLSAFRVNGNPTPEPISLVVFGTLLVGGGLVARKRLMKKAVA